MKEKFFDDFQESSKKSWEAQALKDLKGKNFEETLIWNTPEGIRVQPYYAAEDLTDLNLTEIQQAQRNKKNILWQNRPTIEYTDEKTTNNLVINALQNGADAITIDFTTVDLTQIDFARLLDKIKLADTPVFFQTKHELALLGALQKHIHYQPKGGLMYNPLENYFKGETSIEAQTWESTKNLLLATASYPSFNVIQISSEVFHNAGATAVQELAFTLASATTYLDKLTASGLPVEQITAKIEFSVAIGTNYFMEIAKLRSLRFLWQKILEAYQSENICCQINAKTSWFYDSALDPHTNMLRATTEAMAAIIGGCDSLTTHAYNAVSGNEYSEMGERIARNISTILKEESYLGKSQDVSAGSYFIEHLTADLSHKVWDLFLETEQKGGIIQAFEEGFVKKMLDKAYQEKIQQLHHGKIMVGVNKFIAEKESPQKMPDKPAENPHFLNNHRISEIFE